VGLAQDLRLAIRTLRATPIVTVVAILSLALGIGANTAIFSILDSLLLRPLPVERPDRLALLASYSRQLFYPDGRPYTGVPSWTYPQWEQIHERRHDLFETAFAFSRIDRFNLARGGQTDFADGMWVSGEYFDGLGVRPLLGRTFTGQDDRQGGGPDGAVAVISYDWWQRRFGGAADVIGKTQTIERVPVTIVGVLPPGFFGTEVGGRFDVALPFGVQPLIRGQEHWLENYNASGVRVMARLKADQTLAAAEQAFRGAQAQIREATIARTRTDGREHYLSEPFSVRPAAGGTSSMRGSYRQPILLIMAVVALVLLIACANIANLLLARAAVRRHEFSVRLALGASRWRLARQLLVESLLLAGGGALAGLGIAQWGRALLLRQLSTPGDTVFLDARLDWRVLAFTAFVAAATALLFGLVPALRASRARPIEAIRAHGRHAIGERRIGLSGALVVGQVALSLVLIVTAGLFLRTFSTLTTRDLGFDRDPVLIARLDASGTGVAPAERAALFARVAEAGRAVPGVSHAAMSDATPVGGWIIDLEMEVESGPPMTQPQNISYRTVVTPDWFATYGTRLVAGRDFGDGDRSGSTPVVIVNETFARKMLPEGNPIGRRVRNAHPMGAAESGQWLEVVGVVADANYRSVREVLASTMYQPMAQQPGTSPLMRLSVRAAGGAPALLTRSVAEAIGRVNPAIAITFTPLKEQLDANVVQERLLAMLAGMFGALALLLAGLGLYGVMSYAVSRRRAEIGIRMALGAAPDRVVRLVLSRALLVIGLGMIVGFGVSAWASTLVAPLLYGLQPRDPITLVTSAVVLGIVGGLAGWLPARRASRIDPAIVLRES
jgi:predicted permease